QELTIVRRTGTGKGAARRIRRAGTVPAILYGGTSPENIAVDPKSVLKLIHGHGGTTQLLSLRFDGESDGTRLAVLRELQFDPVSERLLHVDLQEVSATRPITVRVAVHPVGEAVGVKETKGILNLVLHELDVSCLPTAIPVRSTRARATTSGSASSICSRAACTRASIEPGVPSSRTPTGTAMPWRS